MIVYAGVVFKERLRDPVADGESGAYIDAENEDVQYYTEPRERATPEVSFSASSVRLPSHLWDVQAALFGEVHTPRVGARLWLTLRSRNNLRSRSASERKTRHWVVY